MLDLLNLLNQSGQSVSGDLERWFAPYSAGAAYYLVSDYCLGDAGKQHDVYAFEIVLHHDRLSAIEEYIRAVAPSDLKGARKASHGLGQYLVCPVTFSVSFSVAKETRALRGYATVDEMTSFVPEARRVVAAWIEHNSNHAAYFERLDRRLKLLGDELAQKRRNEKLIRQIFLVATFAAYVLELLDDAKAPSEVCWISDRDAMFDRYDGLAFDLAFFFWLLVRSERAPSSPPVPRLKFASPGMDGEQEYAELIRLPDYLAGTLADISLPEIEFSHDKFPPLFSQLFVEASNNAVLQVDLDGEALVTRRVLFGSPRSVWQPLQPDEWKGAGPKAKI
jgi:hypothetical protein